MLVFVEHDHVLHTRSARRLFGKVLEDYDNVQVVVFRPHEAVDAERMTFVYPPALRVRMVVTPTTPRTKDLAFWLSYEVGCAAAAMRHLGKFQPGDSWCALVPPAWYAPLCESFHEAHLMPMPSAFDDIDASRLRTMLGAAKTSLAPLRLAA